MTILRINEPIKIFQLTILLVGVLLVLGAFYVDRSLSSRFELSMITLNSLLPSKNANK